MKRLLLIGLLVVAIGPTLVTASGASTHRVVTLRLSVPQHTLRAGASETVVVTLINPGGALPLASCGVDVAVGLVNAHVHYSIAWPDDICLGNALRHGTTTLHLRLGSVYTYCGGSSAPPCSTHGTPALPKGRYHTVVESKGFPSGVVVIAAATTVTLH